MKTTHHHDHPSPLHHQTPRHKRLKIYFFLAFTGITILFLVSAVLLGKVITKADENSNEDRTITYEITGTNTNIDIKYQTAESKKLQEKKATPPWKQEVTIKANDSAKIVATLGQEEGKVTCRIRYAGMVIAENSATGNYATASCRVPVSHLN